MNLTCNEKYPFKTSYNIGIFFNGVFECWWSAFACMVHVYKSFVFLMIFFPTRFLTISYIQLIKMLVQ